MTSVRLPVNLEQKLEALSRIKAKSKSDLIKEALEQYFIKEASEKDSFELGRELFGKHGSGGDGSLSTTYKQRIKEKLNAKRNPH